MATIAAVFLPLEMITAICKCALPTYDTVKIQSSYASISLAET